jgi:outer membrane protein insertion porin family
MQLKLDFCASSACRQPQARYRNAAGLCMRWLLFAGMLGIVLHAPLAYAGDGGSRTPHTSPQLQQMLASYEGQTVTSIEVAGQPHATTAEYAGLFSQHADQPFSVNKINATVAALRKTGRFTEVQLQVYPEATGVRVLLVLQPAYYFGLFEFPGAEKFSYSRLVQVTNYSSETPYNNHDVRHAVTSLLTFLRQQGYFQATVTPQIQVDSAHRLVNVLFQVTLNRQSRFGVVDIEGTTPAETAKLQKQLQGIWARLRGSAIRPGKTYHYKTLTNATRYMQGELQKKGWLAARVTLQGAEYIAATNRANIHYAVHTGPLLHVKIQGAHLWSWDKKSLLPVYQGAGADPELVQEGRQSLRSYFEGKGYFDAKVNSSFQKGPSGDTIVYSIVKGKKRKVKSVRLVGNKTIPSSKLLPLVTVEKAHFFSRGKYSQSLVRTTTRNLTAVYQANGFSQASVTPAVTQKGNNVAVAFQITEGPRQIVQALQIVGAKTLPPSEYAPKGLKLAAGQPYSQQHVEDDRKTILTNYLERGYLTASFRETARAVSRQQPDQIDVIYHIDEGPRVITRKVITLGRSRTRKRLIQEDISAIQTGLPLTETKLLTAESNLYNHTGVFDWAEVNPRSRITTQTESDVLVKLHEAKRNQLTYGLGFEIINRGGNIPSGTVALPNLPPIGLPGNYTTSQKTYYGPRGTIQYTRNNVRGKGETLSLTGFAGRLDQSGGAYYINPNLRWTHWTATLSLTVEHNGENPIFTSQQELASYQVQRWLDKQKHKLLFFRYSFSKTDLTRIEIPQLVLPQDQHVRLSTVSTSFTRDTRNNILNATRGSVASIELDSNFTQLGSSVDFAELTGQLARYKRIPLNIIWANSIRIGLAQPFWNSRVPLSQEFFTGGGSTLRGYPLDSAGPQRKVQVCSTGSSTDCSFIQVPDGGRELLILNTELRIPLPFKKNLGMVLFYDGGNVFPVVGFSQFTSLYSNSLGTGLRYATPVGPIRVDIGRTLEPIPGINPTQYFISIGQAF